MIHPVAPRRSDVPNSPADAQPSLSPDVATDPPPGPIGWDISVAGDAPRPGAPVPGTVAGPDAPRPASWAEVRQALSAGMAPQADASAVSGWLPATAAPAPAGDARVAVGTVEAAPSAVAARTAAAVDSLGPVGRPRSVLVAAAGAVLTLGLHPVLWARRANREMSQFDPRMSVRPGRTALALSVAVLVPLAVAAAAALRIVADRTGHAPDLPISANLTRWLVLAPAVTPLLVALLPFSLVAAVMTLERVRVVEDRAGIDPERQVRPAARMVWACIPVVGLAVLVTVGQRRLNQVWRRCS